MPLIGKDRSSMVFTARFHLLDIHLFALLLGVKQNARTPTKERIKHFRREPYLRVCCNQTYF